MEENQRKYREELSKLKSKMPIAAVMGLVLAFVLPLVPGRTSQKNMVDLGVTYEIGVLIIAVFMTLVFIYAFYDQKKRLRKKFKIEQENKID